MMNDVISTIKNYDSFAVVTHINPDGDALGSAVALNLALLVLGKKSKVILLNKVPKKYMFSEFVVEYQLLEDVGRDFECIVSVDCADANRLGDAKNLLNDVMTVNIDHHLSNTNFAKINYVQNEPSTGDIIFELLKKMLVHMDKNIATALYIAISTDTGNFTYANTTAESLERCAALIRCGVLVSEVSNCLFNVKSYNTVLLIAKVIDNLRLYYDGKLAVTKINLDELHSTGSAAEDCESVINYARDIDTVELAVFIRQMKNNLYKVSLRSKNGINVMDIAARYGGGGHMRAAGCAMSGDINDITDTILSIAKEYFA